MRPPRKFAPETRPTTPCERCGFIAYIPTFGRVSRWKCSLCFGAKTDRYVNQLVLAIFGETVLDGSPMSEEEMEELVEEISPRRNRQGK